MAMIDDRHPEEVEYARVLLLSLEQMDAAQALRLHSILRQLPFYGAAPGGNSITLAAALNWRTHIVPANPGWKYVARPPDDLATLAAKVTVGVVAPLDVARLLWTGTNNWQGVVLTFPWLSFDDIVATTLWAREIKLWPDQL